MSIKHVLQHIDLYLDNGLSIQERQDVEQHLNECPYCMQHYLRAKRLNAELKTVFHTALGRPAVPPHLRNRVRMAVQERPHYSFFSLNQLSLAFNRVVMLLVMVGFSALAYYVVVQEQNSHTVPLSERMLLSPSDGLLTPTSTPTPQPTPVTVTATEAPTSVTQLGETITLPVTPTAMSNPTRIVRAPHTVTPTPGVVIPRQVFEPAASDEGDSPGGVIAFAVFNPEPHSQRYELHLIHPNGEGHQVLPFEGASEPALRFTATGYQLVYRSWGEENTRRALLRTQLYGSTRPPFILGEYLEDAQPDWSPQEDRVIFASNRASDRTWRLYSIWQDGTNEWDLRREGRAPSFAPDGTHFVFESWNPAGRQRGLWTATLDDAHDAQPILLDPEAKSPDWSPVEARIAYMTKQGDNYDIHLINSDGSNDTPLLSSPANEGIPAWSPDGRWLAFMSDREGSWGIWIAEVETGEAELIYDTGRTTHIQTGNPNYAGREWWLEQISWTN